MLSGIVYFEEILSEIKALTGYTNMRPHYDRIRAAVFKAEGDIGAGGLLVRKERNYTIGDGFYDGTTIILPEDFHDEFSYGALSMGDVHGNTMTLCCVGKTEITLTYMGWLLDNNGNPFTTRNHLEAVVACSVYRLYSPRYFLGKGNRNQYLDYKQDYNDMILMSRGNDAFPTEEQWINIGRIMHGGMITALTDCGWITCPCGSTITSDGDEVSLVEIWSFQFDDILDPRPELPIVTESWLNDNGTLHNEASLLNGKHIDQILIGRIGFAVKTETEDLYVIKDILGNIITNTVFTRTYNSDLGLDIYLSETIYSNGSLYFNFDN